MTMPLLEVDSLVTEFDTDEGRMGVTVTFLSLLELLKEGLIELAQAEAYSPIHVRASSSVELVPGTPVFSEFDDDADDEASDAV